MQDADRIVGDDVLRAGDRKSGDWNTAGERFELHDAERVGEAWKHEHVGTGQVRGENAVVQHAEKFCVGEFSPEFGFLGSGADDDLGAGQIERQERFEILFDGYSTNRHEDRPRQAEIDGAIRTEKVGIYAARPPAEIGKTAL